MRSLLMAAICAGICAGICVASADETTNTRNGNNHEVPASARDLKINKTIQFGPDSNPLMMDYYRGLGSGERPAVVIVHGGGFVRGDSRNVSEAYAADWLTPAGYSAFSINYRLAPGAALPDMINDVKRAIRYIRHHAAELNVDPNRIALLGGSAGGYLSNMVGLMPFGSAVGDEVDLETDRVSAVITLFGPSYLPGIPGIDKLAAARILGSDPVGTGAMLDASPIAHIRSDAPPFLLIHGDADELVPFSQSVLFLDALSNAGVKAELIVIPNGKHATNSWTSTNQPDWEAEVIRFLESAFNPTRILPGVVHGIH